MHIGECMAGRDGCFGYGGIEHKRRDCQVAARREREGARDALTGMYEFP